MRPAFGFRSVRRRFPSRHRKRFLRIAAVVTAARGSHSVSSRLAVGLLAFAVWGSGPTEMSGEEGRFRFEAITIDDAPGNVVYAVSVVDLDSDGRDDIVAITEDKVLWYRPPDWEKHVLVEGMTMSDNVCIAPLDIDDDTATDLAIGAGWPRSGGTIQWLRQGAEITDPWSLHPIAEIPWTHRMRFANVLGEERGDPANLDAVRPRPQLVVSPLNASEGAEGVALTAYSIPDDPINDRWEPTVIDRGLNRLHNHWCMRASDLGWSGIVGKGAVTLTASQEGVHVIYRDDQQADRGEQDEKVLAGSPFRRGRLATGASGDDAASRGAGEVKAGRLANGTTFFATIEPMHGTDAVVYLIDPEAQRTTKRVTLTDRLQGGHALWVADLDQDGHDEVVVGWREPNPEVGIAIYDRQADGSWEEHLIDVGGVACEDLMVADLTFDGRLDIVAGGRSTHNIKLYVNRGDHGDSTR